MKTSFALLTATALCACGSIDPIDTTLEQASPAQFVNDMIPEESGDLREKGSHYGVPWDDGVIPYEFDDDVSNSRRNKMLSAMAHVEARVGVEFIPRTDEDGYVLVENSDGCSASVGQGSGRSVRYLRLAGWCNYYAYVHELGHTLALLHEHEREDADEHLIPKVDPPSDYLNGDGDPIGPFDIASAMLYSSFFYDIDGNSIPEPNGLSHFDTRTLREIYGKEPLVGIQAGTGLWVSSNNGVGAVTADRERLRAWEKFKFEFESDGLVRIVCNNGRYLSSENGEKSMTCNRKEARSWEKFTIVTEEDGQFALKCNNGSYMRRNGAVGIGCNGTASDSRVVFTEVRAD